MVKNMKKTMQKTQSLACIDTPEIVCTKGVTSRVEKQRRKAEKSRKICAEGVDKQHEK